MYAENDVRGQIENGQLLRMWGNVRDLSGHKRKEKELSERLDVMLDILSAAPDPILVLRGDGVLEAANPAFEWCFGWPVDSCLGRNLSSIAQTERPIAEIVSGAQFAPSAESFDLAVTCASGDVTACDARVAALAEDRTDTRAVMTLRVCQTGQEGAARNAV